MGAAIGGAVGGGGYVLAHPGGRPEDYLQSGAFWRATGIGAASGAVAGLTGFAVSGMVGGAGLGAAISGGMLSGGLSGAAGYGTRYALRATASRAFQKLTISANAGLKQNLGSAAGVLKEPEYLAGTVYPDVARMQYGNAVERIVRDRVNGSLMLRSFFAHAGGPNSPDFLGQGFFSDMIFDVTTERAVAAHLARPYGPDLIFGLYERPPGFGTFPRLP